MTGARIQGVLLLLAAGCLICGPGKATAQEVITQPIQRLGDGPLRDIALLPDNQTIVTAGTWGALLWNGATGEPIRELTGETPPPIVTETVVSPDGNTLAICTSARAPNGAPNGEIQIWDIATGNRIRTISPVFSGSSDIRIGFSPDGTRIVWGTDASLQIWIVATGQQEYAQAQQGVLDAVVSADYTKILAGFNSNAEIIDKEYFGIPTHIFDFGSGPEKFLTVRYSPDESRVLTSSAIHGAVLWDVATDGVLRTYSPPPAGTGVSPRAEFSPDGTHVFANRGGGGTGSPTVVQYNTDTGAVVRSYAGGRFFRLGLDGTKMVVVADSSTSTSLLDAAPVAVVDTETGVREAPFMTQRSTRGVSFSTDGQRVWSSLDAGSVWDVEEGRWLAAVRSPAWPSPDLSRALTRAGGGNWQVEEVQTHGILSTLAPIEDSLSEGVFSFDNLHLLTAETLTTETRLRLWNVEDASLLSSYLGAGEAVYTGFSSRGPVAFVHPTQSSPDLLLIDMTNGSVEFTLQGAVPAGEQLVGVYPFQQQGQSMFAVVTSLFQQFRFQLFDSATHETVKEFTYDPGKFQLVLDLSPDGRYLLVLHSLQYGNSYPIAGLVDLETGETVRLFEGQRGLPLEGAFSPDGTRILTTSGDGTSFVWESGLEPVQVPTFIHASCWWDAP